MDVMYVQLVPPVPAWADRIRLSFTRFQFDSEHSVYRVTPVWLLAIPNASLAHSETLVMFLSGQKGLTVDQLRQCFLGSNPSVTTRRVVWLRLPTTHVCNNVEAVHLSA